jgi:putative nucleotidyltransferase with HDIG domain
MQPARIPTHSLPAAVHMLAARLAAAGGRAWLVGGTVRDLLLGEQPRDFDLATDLAPDAVVRAVPEVDARDARFGTCGWRGDPDVAITTLRAEQGYRDRRRPDHVVFVREPVDDAPRRDFTVNALYAEPASGTVLDPVGGLADLARRRLATIGAPAVRFGEDPLRLLRALRFAARLDFELDAATAAAARATAPALASLSAERVFQELTASFTGPRRGRALRAFVELGFAAVLLPELAAMDGVPQPPEYHPEGDVLTHVCLVLDAVPPDDPVQAWSALLHDVGKPPTFRVAEDRIRFDGHDVRSAEMADGILRRLRASSELRELVVDICRQHLRFAALPGMRPAKAERWLRSPTFAQHLVFHRADCLGCHGRLDVAAWAEQALASLGPLKPPLVTGQDVLDLGVAPGPRVGELLRAFTAAVDELPAPPDRDAALVLLRELIDSRRQGGDAAAR